MVIIADGCSAAVALVSLFTLARKRLSFSNEMHGIQSLFTIAMVHLLQAWRKINFWPK